MEILAGCAIVLDLPSAIQFTSDQSYILVDTTGRARITDVGLAIINQDLDSLQGTSNSMLDTSNDTSKSMLGTQKSRPKTSNLMLKTTNLMPDTTMPDASNAMPDASIAAPDASNLIPDTSNSMLGTSTERDPSALWTAPEILVNQGTYSKEADVFSFAGVAIEVRCRQISWSRYMSDYRSFEQRFSPAPLHLVTNHLTRLRWQSCAVNVHRDRSTRV